jgi:5-methylcytosine-specific restriction endonuclease McrA
MNKKEVRHSIQSIKSKIKLYKSRFFPLADTPSNHIRRRAKQNEVLVAWERTLALYKAKFGDIDVEHWGETQDTLHKLDRLLTRVIRVIHPDCVVCGKRPLRQRDSQASHLLPKSQYPGLRYELGNVFHCCSRCHSWWHNNPIEAYLWLLDKNPNKVEFLLNLRDKPLYTTSDYDKIKQKFQEILENK